MHTKQLLEVTSEPLNIEPPQSPLQCGGTLPAFGPSQSSLGPVPHHQPSLPSLSQPLPAHPTHPPIAYWVWLAIPSVILLLAAIMSAGSDRQVSLPGLGVLPETCTMHVRLGIDCPGCGLTRSFIHLAHGKVAAAWELNPVGLFLFAFVLLQIPLAIGGLLSDRRLHPIQLILRRATPWNQIFLIVLLVALLIQWLVRIGFASIGAWSA